jgi:MFS family permease
MSPLRIILVTRALRALGDGFLAVLVPAYLLELGFDAVAAGILGTATLIGSAAMTLGVGMIANRFGRRALLSAAALLMAATGSGFLLTQELGPLLLVALLGTFNPTTGDVSVFLPLEQATLAQFTPDRQRTAQFARTSLIGALAGALGALAAGLPDGLAAWDWMGRAEALRAMIALYGLLGLAAFFLYRRLPKENPTAHQPASPLGPSKAIVLRLAALFSLDAFAGGLIVQSLLALWLFERFGLSLAAAGAFFFTTGVLSAFSYPLAVRIAHRIGLINTMVFTHLPAGLLLIGAALAPNLGLALGLLALRALLSQMDVPTRASYVMAVVTPAERGAAASLTALPRSLAAALGPALAGWMMGALALAAPLVICGGLKILYDLLLYAQFRSHRPPEEASPGA